MYSCHRNSELGLLPSLTLAYKSDNCDCFTNTRMRPGRVAPLGKSIRNSSLSSTPMVCARSSKSPSGTNAGTTALSDVPPGPDWLHDIALQHYDYMSHGGRGWFEDIDALEKHIAREDRGKVLLTISGWYDAIGRYTFDERTGALDDKWTLYPNLSAFKDKFPNAAALPMSKAEMHRWMRYARDRGFKVALYFFEHGIGLLNGIFPCFFRAGLICLLYAVVHPLE